MEHKITTLNTKRVLAASLKKLMPKKALSKITVSEIVADCGVNRKTFYYHFEDIASLLIWMLEQEAVEVVKKFDLLVDCEDAILFVMDYVDANQHILNCAFDSLGREGLKKFLYADFIGILRATIDNAEQELNLSVTGDYKQFLCDFYGEALAGILIEWFRTPGKSDREKTLRYLITVLRTTLPQALYIEGRKEKII